MKTRLLVIVIGWMLVLYGCTTSVDPILGTEHPFTLWGVINPKTDTHTVRVFEIEDRLRLLSPEPLDVSVASTHIQSGERRVWRDSTVQLADGDFRHIFWATFQTRPGDIYSLEVTDSDGESSRTSSVTVPPPITFEVLPPDLDQLDPINLPVLIQGDPPQIPRIDVEYFAKTVPQLDSNLPIPNPVIIGYEGTLLAEGDNLLLNIDLRKDFQLIQRNFFVRGLPFDFITIDSLELRIHIGDKDWVSPVATFNPNLLVEPGTFSNVSNGFGFFGSGYMERAAWLPPGELLQRAGFIRPMEDGE